MSTTWKAAIGVILVFILGWFGGALSTLVIAHREMIAIVQLEPEQLTRLLERAALRNLDVDDGKRRELHELIAANIRQRMALQKQVQPQVKAIDRQTLDQINALLTPEQQQRFQENLARLKQRLGRNPFPVDDESATSAPGAAPPSPPDKGT